jgi:hypothetical protein
MRRTVATAGAILLVQGVAGLLHHVLGWFGSWAVVRHLGFLEGYEIFANLVLVVLGAALVVAARARSEPPR